MKFVMLLMYSFAVTEPFCVSSFVFHYVALSNSLSALTITGTFVTVSSSVSGSTVVIGSKASSWTLTLISILSSIFTQTYLNATYSSSKFSTSLG